MQKTLAIIGAGKVGSAIAHLAKEAGYCVSIDRRDTLESSELALLTVHDSEIENLCCELASQHAFKPGGTVAHCSGSLTSEILSSARRDCRCFVASIHPLQSFPTFETAVARLPGSFWFWEGDENVSGQVQSLVTALRGKAYRIDPAAKPSYHAAAVIAHNYVIALIDAALKLAKDAGIARDVAKEGFKPLVDTAVEAAFSLGPEKSLTGPVTRGDVKVVQEHIKALKTDPEILSIYSSLGKHSIKIARRTNAISEETAKILNDVLDK